MKAFVITALAFSGFAATADQFICQGITADTGDKVQVSGNYTGDPSGGEYEMIGSLRVRGTDSTGASIFSSTGGTSRSFSDYSISLGSNRGVFYVDGVEENGSKVTIRHIETNPGGSYILLDLQPTASMGSYWHKFNNAKCRFLH